MKWLDLSKLQARLVLAEDLLREPYLALVTSKPPRTAAAGLERAGFRKLYHGDYGLFFENFSAESLLQRLEAVQLALPDHISWREDAALADIYPQLHERCNNGHASFQEQGLYDALRRTLDTRPGPINFRVVPDDGPAGPADLPVPSVRLAGEGEDRDIPVLRAGLHAGLQRSASGVSAIDPGRQGPDQEGADGQGVREADQPAGTEPAGGPGGVAQVIPSAGVRASAPADEFPAVLEPEVVPSRAAPLEIEAAAEPPEPFDTPAESELLGSSPEIAIAEGSTIQQALSPDATELAIPVDDESEAANDPEHLHQAPPERLSPATPGDDDPAAIIPSEGGEEVLQELTPEAIAEAEQRAIDQLIERREALSRNRPTARVRDRANPLTIDIRRRHDIDALSLVANLSQARAAAESKGEVFLPELEDEQMATLAAFSSNLAAGGISAEQLAPSLGFASEFLRLARTWGPDAIDRPGHEELVSYNERAERELQPDDVRALLFRHEVFAASKVTDEFASKVLWAAARKAGFIGGNVLIANSGNGVISRQRPDDLPASTTQVPNEPMLFEIANALHPEDAVIPGLYESVVLPGAYYDLAFAVSHHSQGRRQAAEAPLYVADEAINAESDTPPLKKGEHLLYKTIQRVRPGGVAFVILPKEAIELDARGHQVLTKVARYGEFVTASVFAGQIVSGHVSEVEIGRKTDNFNATQATDQDYILLQVRRRDSLMKEEDASHHVDQTFADLQQRRSQGMDYLDQVRIVRNSPDFAALDASSEEAYRLKYEAAIADEGLRLIGLVPEASLLPHPDDRPAEGRALVLRQAPLPNETLPAVEGTFELVDGDVGYRQGGEVRPVDLPAQERAVVRNMIPVRDLMRKALDFQLASNDDVGLREIQRDLRRAYDVFHQAHGPISRGTTLAIFRADAFSASLLQLENYDVESDTAEPTVFFTERVVRQQTLVHRAETVQEALSISMGRHGAVEPKLISALMQRPWSDLRKELANEIFLDPLDGQWVTAAQYLSGPVRAKLHSARTAQLINPDLFRTNAAALAGAQPRDVTPEEIDVTIGAPWVPVWDYKRFVCDLLGVQPEHREAEIEVTYDRIGARYGVKINTGVCGARQVLEYSIPNSVTVQEMIEATLNGRSIKVLVDDPNPNAVAKKGKDKPKITDHVATTQAHMYQEKVREEFAHWVVANAHRANRLARIYNWRVNAYRDRTYSGDYLPFELLSPTWVPMDHQRHGVARGIEDGNVLFAHCLGSGKTFTLAASAVEPVRMGLISKPLLTTPKNTFAQTAAEIIKAYPTAKVLIADTLSPKNPAGIREFVARASMDHWDLILLTHDSFKAIPLSARAQIKILNRELLESQKERSLAGGDAAIENRREKMIGKRIERLRQKAAEEAQSGADQHGFEMLGVDRILVDEAHFFKNLDVATKMNVLGITTAGSDRARDLQAKIHHVRAFNGNGRGVVFATATPICNTIAEMYLMQHLVNMGILQSVGIRHFDAWAATFGKVQALIEQKPAGDGFQIRERFSRFQNVPEMIRTFRMVADLRTDDDLPQIQQLRPSMETELVVSPRDEADLAYLKTLEVRARALEQKTPYWAKDSVIVIMGDLQRGMLDLRLIDPTLPENPNSIARLIARKGAEIYRETTEILGTQFIFCDQGIHGNPFSLYRDMVQKLVEEGVPAKEIAVINDYEKPHEKHKLIQQFNKGKIRFIIGSSTKIGVGVNAQRNVVAMHHADIPFRPDQLAQRIGRGHRPGNRNKHVRNFVYAKDGQTRRFEIVQNKVAAIQQAFKNPDKAARRLGEDMEATLESVQLELTDNPGLREKVQLDAALKTLQMLNQAHVRSTAMYRFEAENLRESIDRSRARAEAIGAFVQVCNQFMEQFRADRTADDAELQKAYEKRTAAREAASAAGADLRQFKEELENRARAAKREFKAEQRETRNAEKAAQKLAEREQRAALKRGPAIEALDAGLPDQSTPPSVDDLLVEARENPEEEIEFSYQLSAEEQEHLDGLVKAAAAAAEAQREASRTYEAWVARDLGFRMDVFTVVGSPASPLRQVNELEIAGRQFTFASNTREASRGAVVPVGRLGPFEVSFQMSSLLDARSRLEVCVSDDTRLLGLEPSMLTTEGFIHFRHGDVVITSAYTNHGRSNILRIMNLIQKIPEVYEERIGVLGKKEEQYRELMAKAEEPFGRADEMAQLTRRKLELDAQLLQQQARISEEEERLIMYPMMDARHATSGRPVHPERLREWVPNPEMDRLDDAPMEPIDGEGPPHIDQLRAAADRAEAELLAAQQGPDEAPAPLVVNG